VVYIHNGVFLSHKEEWNYVTCRKMEWKVIMLSKITQIE
jgi:hypothetical protein